MIMKLILSIIFLIITVRVADSERLRPIGVGIGLFVGVTSLMIIW